MKCIRIATWYKTSVVVAAAFFLGLAGTLFHTQGFSWLTLVSFLFLIGAIMAVYEVFSARVVLGDNSLDIVSLLSKRSFDRSRITTVKAEGGCVFIKVEGDDGWVKLPDMGRGNLGVSNTIRAWLKTA